MIAGHPGDKEYVREIEAMVAKLDAPAEVKILIVLSVAFPLMFASYQLLVRHSFIGAILNGPRESRSRAKPLAAKPAAAAPQGVQS